MKLGLVTYQLGAGWDLDTLIEKCSRLGFEGVELRTTHKHGVEPAISPSKRAEVKGKFENSPVELVGLGSCCEYHSGDPAELQKNIEMTKEFVILAHDVGAAGVKVRPNALPPGIPRGKTLEQIGVALREAAGFASGYGVKIRLEVHGRETSRPSCVKQIVDIADSRNLFVCWNSGKNDLDESGSIEQNFHLLKDRIELCHINELSSDYPWTVLFSLLQKEGYGGFCLAEVPASSEPERLMEYYRALFNAFQQLASKCQGG